MREMMRGHAELFTSIGKIVKSTQKRSESIYLLEYFNCPTSSPFEMTA